MAGRSDYSFVLDRGPGSPRADRLPTAWSVPTAMTTPDRPTPGDGDGADRQRDRPAPLVAVPVAPGELLDKITILRIKQARLGDPRKRANVRVELALLEEAERRQVAGSDALDALVAELHSVNESIWDVEEAIRGCERARSFGAEFVALARTVYQANDLRAELKRRINDLLGSDVREEKSHDDPP